MLGMISINLAMFQKSCMNRMLCFHKQKIMNRNIQNPGGRYSQGNDTGFGIELFYLAFDRVDTQAQNFHSIVGILY